MRDKATVRINFDFPKEEYPYLKFICSKRGISIRKQMTEVVLKLIEEYEDLELSQICDERIKSRKEEDLISWDEAKKLAGWK